MCTVTQVSALYIGWTAKLWSYCTLSHMFGNRRKIATALARMKVGSFLGKKLSPDLMRTSSILDTKIVIDQHAFYFWLCLVNQFQLWTVLTRTFTRLKNTIVRGGNNVVHCIVVLSYLFVDGLKRIPFEWWKSVFRMRCVSNISFFRRWAMLSTGSNWLTGWWKLRMEWTKNRHWIHRWKKLKNRRRKQRLWKY